MGRPGRRDPWPRGQCRKRRKNGRKSFRGVASFSFIHSGRMEIDQSRLFLRHAVSLEWVWALGQVLWNRSPRVTVCCQILKHFLAFDSRFVELFIRHGPELAPKLRGQTVWTDNLVDSC